MVNVLLPERMWRAKFDGPDIETLVENERIFVARRGGIGSKSCVVAFGGAQLGFGGFARIEFARSLSVPAVCHDTYFVLEKQGSFYNDVHDEVVEILTPLVSMRDVYFLGNSMGGFGALTFDVAFPRARATIAFGPQYNVAPGGPVEEYRFREYIDRVTEWRHGCVTSSRGARRFIFFGEHDDDDRPHLAAFLKADDPNTRVYVVRNCAHDVARYLRDRGLLHSIFDIVINEGASHDDVSRILVEQLAG